MATMRTVEAEQISICKLYYNVWPPCHICEKDSIYSLEISERKRYKRSYTLYSCSEHFPKEISSYFDSIEITNIRQGKFFPALCLLCSEPNAPAYYILYTLPLLKITTLKFNTLTFGNLTAKISNKTSFASHLCYKHFKSFLSPLNIIDYIKQWRE
jgi:hypothetical protein